MHLHAIKSKKSMLVIKIIHETLSGNTLFSGGGGA